MMKKKGISGVITTVILVLLALVAAGVVWGIANNIINKQIKNVNSCFGNSNKVQINYRLTCYNSSSKEFKFALEIKDIKVDEILISISNADSSESFRLTSEGTPQDDIRTFSSSYGESVKIPRENAGITYFINAGSLGIENVNFMKIAPVIDGEQCDIFDSFSEIDDCNLIA